jgi:glycosyltransferase involved in cell wall biosynthesis
MPNISIIIRCYNEEEHIGRLLLGIIQQTHKSVEIIVVDSGSTDATLSIASRYPVNIVQIAPHEFSFGRSLNRGCASATGDILVFASAHVYPLYDDWLEKIVRPFADPKVALSYGGQRGAEVTKYSEHQVFAQWFPVGTDLDQQNPFCNNANAAVRRSLWEQHPYDESLTGLEDIEWARRIMAAGQKIAYVGEAVVAHVHNETPRRIFNRYHREAIALKRIYPAEHFTLRDLGYLLTTNVISDLYHAARDRVLLGNVTSILVFRCMQFMGTYRGYRFRGPVSNRLRQTFYYPRGLTRGQGETDPTHTRRMIDYSTG